MHSKMLIVALLSILCNSVQAQTLFTYGTHAVSKDEFLKAFNKNPDTSANKQEKLQEYLDLYINFRLKLQAAYDEKANTRPELIADAEGFKGQLAENYINRGANLTGLIQEAFLRSQKDILLQQVFIPFSGSDSAKAFAAIVKAQNDLNSGKDFGSVTIAYSTDTLIQQTRGNIGYITVFTLPYSIENLVYNLKQGSYSSIYKSGGGYHIFKNAAERPAVGRRIIQQLLFPLPPVYTAADEAVASKTADSVFKLLQGGAAFAPVFSVFGHSNYDQGPGTMEVKLGDYSPDFEEQVFNLKNTGDVSQPFKTAYGYNIIKLTEKLVVSTDENDVAFIAWLQTQIQNSGRLDAAKSALMEKWQPRTGFREAAYNKADLWKYTDSALNAGKLPAVLKTIKPETVLFQFTKQKVSVKQWIEYLQGNMPGGVAEPAAYKKQLHNFTRFSAYQYFRSNIEDFDSSAAEQIKEFNDANMLFYEMDKHVWSKAANDSLGQQQYFDQHKAKYTWQKSVAALVISVPDKIQADSIALQIKKNPQQWRNILAAYENIYADSSRFEESQLPVKQDLLLHKDFQTTPEINESGDAFTFVHILQVYTEPGQKNFDEARGLVINDYQLQLEKAWLENLKKQYPVKVNNAVLNSIY